MDGRMRPGDGHAMGGEGHGMKVCVVGAGGFIGSWLVKTLLERGYRVNATVRNSSDGASNAHLWSLVSDNDDSLQLLTASLPGSPASFQAAVDGCDYVCHVASSLPHDLATANPNADIVEPTVQGVENVLKAVIKAGVARKVVVLSSLAAIHGDEDSPLNEFTEEDWNSSSTLTSSPFQLAKTLAERAAWRIYGSQFPRSPSRVTGAPCPFRQTGTKSPKNGPFELVTLNVGTVLGPFLTESHGRRSPKLILDLLRSSSRTCPQVHVPVVDVRDVARAHVAALENPEANGRYLLVAEDLTLFEIANILRPNYPRPTFMVPTAIESSWHMRLKGTLLTREEKAKLVNIGKKHCYKNEKARTELGITFANVRDTILDTAESLVDFDFLLDANDDGHYVQVLH